MLAMVFLFNLNVGAANFISSFVAVTFVWFIALRVVFTNKYKGNSFFLVMYWGWQFVSILFYSYLISQFVNIAHFIELSKLLHIEWQALAKVIITPFNLITNFLFMFYLTRFMEKKGLIIGK